MFISIKQFFKISCCPLFYYNFNLMQKTVDQMLRECKEVTIQGMEKTLQHKMVYMFLKDRKKDNDVKQFSVNGKDGIIKMEFFDHEKAKAFYDEANFVEKILIRPFNIYFNLTLTEAEMKKYYLEGITEENQRQLFKECRKIGVCKLYTSYSSGPRGKLKSTGVLSFIRRDQIAENDFKSLKDNLGNLGIKINNYIHERGLKCSINIVNFYNDADINADESLIQAQGEKRIRSLFNETKVEKESGLTVIVKKKDAIPEKSPAKVIVTAIIEYADVQQTMRQFEKMRSYLVKNEGDTKAVLFFHNQENNSYLSLFTMGLGKPKELSEKQFQNKLLLDFKKINPNVIQVNVFNVKFNDSYIGRIYLKTEQDGKDFIIDYSTKRALIYENYKEIHAPITFNISVDTKTLRKIKLSERKAKETEEKIKKQSEANRRETRRPVNGFPIQPTGMPMMGPNVVMPNMQPPFQTGMPPVGLPPPMAPGGPLYGQPPQMLKPPIMSGLQNMPISHADSMRKRIAHIVKDKSTFNAMHTENVKRAVVQPLKFLIEQNGILPNQSGAILHSIMSSTDDIQFLIKLLEFPSELRNQINIFKH